MGASGASHGCRSVLARFDVYELDSESFRGSRGQAVVGAVDPPPPVEAAVGLASTFVTDNGHRVHCLLQEPPDDERWTVVSSVGDGPLDVASEDHRRRWHDYLQWAHILQFLRSDGRDAVIYASSMGGEALQDLWIVDAEDASDDDAGNEPSAAMLEELDLVDDDAVRQLVAAVLRAGEDDFVAGFELDDGRLVEAGWPERRVGIARVDEPVPSAADWGVAKSPTGTLPPCSRP